MAKDHDEHVGGKGFAPTEHNVDEHHDQSATTVHGSGKEFAPDVGDPDTDESARQTQGSGKQFAWLTETEIDESELDDERVHGSGKQFKPRPDDG